MKLMIDISEQDFHRVCQGYIDYSNTLEGRCLVAISEGVSIPENAYIIKRRRNKMVKKIIGNVEIKKSEDPSKVIKAFEDGGFTLIYDFENEFTRFYNIAVEMEEQKNAGTN